MTFMTLTEQPLKLNKKTEVGTISPTFVLDEVEIQKTYYKFNTVMGKTLELTDATFDETLKSDKPVLVDFWAEWCGPCKMIGPVVEELASDYEGKAVIAKLNVDENPQVTARFGVRSIPTLLVFKNGQIVDKQVGAVPKSVLAGKLQAQVA